MFLVHLSAVYEVLKLLSDVASSSPFKLRPLSLTSISIPFESHFALIYQKPSSPFSSTRVISEPSSLDRFFRQCLFCGLEVQSWYESVCNQFIITHYVSINKIIHMYFSHVTYLMSHMISLNNICEWFYKMLLSRLQLTSYKLICSQTLSGLKQQIFVFLNICFCSFGFLVGDIN